MSKEPEVIVNSRRHYIKRRDLGEQDDCAEEDEGKTKAHHNSELVVQLLKLGHKCKSICSFR